MMPHASRYKSTRKDHLPFFRTGKNVQESVVGECSRERGRVREEGGSEGKPLTLPKAREGRAEFLCLPSAVVERLLGELRDNDTIFSTDC
jgi:hypothetical protein